MPQQPSRFHRPSSAYRRARNVLIAVVLGATVFNGAVHIVQHTTRHSTEQRQVRQAKERQTFWRIVAGQPQQQFGASDQTLAADLAQQLGPISFAARTLPDSITSFAAPSNADYGGVTSAIGINPFTNTGCYECGGLTKSFKDNLLVIKQGGLDQLLAMTQPPHQSRLRITPFGLSVWLTLVLLGILCGGIMLAERVLTKRMARQSYHALRAKYPRQTEQLAQADALLAIKPPPGYDTSATREHVRQVRDQLAAELTRQSDPSVQDNADQIARYEAQLTSGLQELTDGIEGDRLAKHELGIDQT